MFAMRFWTSIAAIGLTLAAPTWADDNDTYAAYRQTHYPVQSYLSLSRPRLEGLEDIVALKPFTIGTMSPDLSKAAHAATLADLTRIKSLIRDMARTADPATRAALLARAEAQIRAEPASGRAAERAQTALAFILAWQADPMNGAPAR